MNRDVGDAELENLDNHLKELKENFITLNLMQLNFRKSQLAALKTALQESEDELAEALQKDLGVNRYLAFLQSITDISATINDQLRNLDEWTKPRPAALNVMMWPGNGYVYPQGKGVYCVFGAWNFPINLVLNPMITAIAAGNCVLVKPSEQAPECSAYLKKLLDKCLDPRFYRCFEGGVKTSIKLSNMPFDGIVFTGGSETGKLIAQAAAKNLVPCVLELGGKNPAVVDASAD